MNRYGQRALPRLTPGKIDQLQQPIRPSGAASNEVVVLWRDAPGSQKGVQGVKGFSEVLYLCAIPEEKKPPQSLFRPHDTHSSAYSFFQSEMDFT